MKTINELDHEGLMSTRLWNCIYRNAAADLNELRGLDRYGRSPGCVTEEDVFNMSIKDLFDLIGEDRIKRWRCLGAKTLAEMKGLI